jgi:hypothetical protein
VIGLRRCAVCGAVLSTPLHMADHLAGNKHCEQVARLHLSKDVPYQQRLRAASIAAQQQLNRQRRQCDRADTVDNAQPEPIALDITVEDADAVFCAHSSSILGQASTAETKQQGGQALAEGCVNHEENQRLLLGVDAADVAMVLLDTALHGTQG